MTTLEHRAIGTSFARLDGPAKVTGTATYAFEYPVDAPLYLHPLQATIAKGRVTAIDTAEAAATDGVAAIFTVFDAPTMADTSDGDLVVLQDDQVHYRGQFVGGVIADSAETARHAASLVNVAYEIDEHDTELRADHPGLYAPEQVNSGYDTDSSNGDVEAALRVAAVTVDQIYTTPHEHNNPMEPHATIALWQPDGPKLTLYDSTQGVHAVRQTLAKSFGLDEEQVRVVAKNVGGGFGSKGAPHSHDVLTVMAAQRVPGRHVKLALTRQQMFAVVGYRTPTIQHVRLGADRAGRLTAISHDVVEQTGTVKEYAEQTATATRMMYASATRQTSHRLAKLDVAVPFWMRAPGECPGMFALEVAMDELAVACDVDPVELRIRNEPAVDPETGSPWSNRRLVDCLRIGADRFGWAPRAPKTDGEWLVGTGMASAVYPAMVMPGNAARISYPTAGRYLVEIGAVDIGTGAWTALTQIAADALGRDVDAVDVQIGDSDLPSASVAGGSSGTSSWGRTIVAAAQAFRKEHGDDPPIGAATVTEAPDADESEQYGMYSFGAHFVEVRVNRYTGEPRVSRMLGVFSIGRVINPMTLRSQLIGGMTMGLSMALHEESIRDHRFGHVVTQDFANYHISSHADIPDIEAVTLDALGSDVDQHANPMGSRGAGEIGIVGSAAAVVNAVRHATGIRVRDLPVTCDKLLG